MDGGVFCERFPATRREAKSSILPSMGVWGRTSWRTCCETSVLSWLSWAVVFWAAWRLLMEDCWPWIWARSCSGFMSFTSSSWGSSSTPGAPPQALPCGPGWPFTRFEHLEHTLCFVILQNNFCQAQFWRRRQPRNKNFNWRCQDRFHQDWWSKIKTKTHNIIVFPKNKTRMLTQQEPTSKIREDSTKYGTKQLKPVQIIPAYDKSFFNIIF